MKNISNLFSRLSVGQQVMPLTADISDATVDHLEQAVAFEQYLRLSQPENISAASAEATKNFKKYGQLFMKAIKHAEELVEEALRGDLEPKVREKFELVKSRIYKLEEQHLEYEAGFEEILAGGIENQELIGQLTKLEKDLALSFETLMVELEHFTGDLAKKTDSTTQQAIQNIMIIGAVAVLLGMVISWFVAMGMVRTERDANVMRQCLTSLKNNVLIADENDDLVYMNNSSESALRELQEEIR